MKAAVDLGVKHVVIASSIAAYGFLYAPTFWMPDYLPLDKGHPCRPQDPYGLSKLMGERVADSFAAAHEMTVSSLRLPGVNFDLSYQNFPERWKNPANRLGGFWSYVDARDAAAACRLALETNFRGHEVFNAGAPTSTMKEPTEELVQRFLPDLKNTKKGLRENWSGLDSSKAERTLGFKAEHVWQRYVDVM